MPLTVRQVDEMYVDSHEKNDNSEATRPRPDVAWRKSKEFEEIDHADSC